MSESHWKRKARALARLAEDQRGKPEGDTARQKLLEIIQRHPEARDYEPVKTLIKKDLTMRDISEMRHAGISTDGEWTADDLHTAIKLMEADYRERIARSKRLKLEQPETT